jgi:transposase-like protein
MTDLQLSPEFISPVTVALLAAVTAWLARPAEPMHTAVFFDAPRMNIPVTTRPCAPMPPTFLWAWTRH